MIFFIYQIILFQLNCVRYKLHRMDSTQIPYGDPTIVIK